MHGVSCGSARVGWRQSGRGAGRRGLVATPNCCQRFLCCRRRHEVWEWGSIKRRRRRCAARGRPPGWGVGRRGARAAGYGGALMGCCAPYWDLSDDLLRTCFAAAGRAAGVNGASRARPGRSPTTSRRRHVLAARPRLPARAPRGGRLEPQICARLIVQRPLLLRTPRGSVSSVPGGRRARAGGRGRAWCGRPRPPTRAVRPMGARARGGRRRAPGTPAARTAQARARAPGCRFHASGGGGGGGRGIQQSSGGRAARAGARPAGGAGLRHAAQLGGGFGGTGMGGRPSRAGGRRAAWGPRATKARAGPVAGPRRGRAARHAGAPPRGSAPARAGRARRAKARAGGRSISGKREIGWIKKAINNPTRGARQARGRRKQSQRVGGGPRGGAPGAAGGRPGGPPPAPG